MATRSLGALTLDLLVKIGGFVAGMDKAARESEKRLKDIERTAKKVGTAIGIALGATAGAFTLMIRNALNTADELGNLSSKVGISVEALSELQFAAEQSDVSSESLSAGLIKLNDAIAQAGNGAKSQSAAFAALGVSVRDAEGNLRNGHDVLLDVAEALAGAKDGAAKTAIVLDIFGKSGADLIPLLAEGAEGIRKFEDQARSMGLTISTETAAAADQFDKNLKTLKASFTGVARSIAGEIAPALVDLSDQVNSESFRNGLREIVKLAVDAAKAVTGLIQKVGDLKENGNFNKLIREQKYLQDTIDKRTNGKGVLEFFGRDVDKELVDLKKRLSDVRAELKAIADEKGFDDKAMSEAIAAEGFGRKVGGKDPRRDLVFGGGEESETAKAAKKNAEAIQAVIDKLKEQSATFGQTAAQSDLYTLSQLNASQSQVEYAKTLADSIDAREKAAEIDKYLASLKEEAITVQDAREQTEAYKLTLLGASQAQIEEAQALVRQIEEQKRFNDLKQESKKILEAARTPLQEYKDEVSKLNEMLSLGIITQDEYNTAVEASQDAFDKAKKAADPWAKELESITDQAARNIQDSFADFLFDPFEKGLSGMLSSFADTLQRMAAEAAAAQIFKALAGAAGAGLFGSGGFLESILGSGSSFGSSNFGGPLAAGGPVMPGKTYLVGEQGPELFRSNTAGSIIPNGAGMGGTVINVNIPLTAPTGSVNRQTLDQITSAALAGAQRSQARNR